MGNSFSTLDEKEMVLTLNEGTNLMNNLQIFFENNEKIMVFIYISLNKTINFFINSLF